MFDLIMPVAGGSTRFQGTRPKWLLTHPEGNLMFYEALRGLPLEKFDRIFITCLQQHDEQFHCAQAIRNQMAKHGLTDKLQIIVLPEATKHQPETVAKTLRLGNITGAFVVKDSDNYFELEAEPGNFVSVADAYKLPADGRMNLFNKSYVSRDDHQVIVNIVEKQVISNLFCTGAYGFASSAEFLTYYDKLSHESNLYLSHVIYSMILADHNFFARECTNYLDWGTLDDWMSFCRQYGAVFVDLDGTLVQNSAEFFDPIWGSTPGIAANIKAVNALYDSGKVRVVITTSRHASSREVTIAQLQREGIKYHEILFGMNHGKRLLINDFAKTNPYPSCEAVNIARNSADLAELIKGFFKS